MSGHTQTGARFSSTQEAEGAGYILLARYVVKEDMVDGSSIIWVPDIAELAARFLSVRERLEYYFASIDQVHRTNREGEPFLSLELSTYPASLLCIGSFWFLAMHKALASQLLVYLENGAKAKAAPPSSPRAAFSEVIRPLNPLPVSVPHPPSVPRRPPGPEATVSSVQESSSPLPSLEELRDKLAFGEITEREFTFWARRINRRSKAP